MKLRNIKVRDCFTLYIHNILTCILFFSSAEDEAAAARITSKNGLESYTYNLRNSLNDEKLADKFEPAGKTKLEDAVNETIKWLDASQEASKEEYEEKQKELEVIAKYVTSFWSKSRLFVDSHFPSPIMQKLYSAAGGAPGAAPGDFPGASESGPSVEEVD